VKVPAPYYAFFGVIEIATTAAIVWLAWRWAAAPSFNQTSTSFFPESN
jgi:hypothetical protein